MRDLLISIPSTDTKTGNLAAPRFGAFYIRRRGA
jgi:hypothetical protein